MIKNGNIERTFSLCTWSAIKACGSSSALKTYETKKLVHIAGSMETYEDYFMGSVHVQDVALAQILLYENTSASGRHLCVEAISHYGDVATKVAELYPEYKIPRYYSKMLKNFLYIQGTYNHPWRYSIITPSNWEMVS